MPRSVLSHAIASCVFAASVTFAAPSFATIDAARFYEDAMARFNAADYSAALVQLKNALQQDAQHMPSLLLTGQAQFKLGDPAAAKDALERALALGADPSSVYLDLAQAYLQLGEYSTLLQRLLPEDLPATLGADLLGCRAQAYLGLHDLDNAAHALAAAEALDPSALLADLARVTLALRRDQTERARTIGDKLIREHPEDARAWNSHGSALHASGLLTEALASYGRAVVLDPGFVDVRVARVALLVDLNRDEEARPDLDYLEQKFPYEPRAAYLRGLIYGRAGHRDGELAEMRKAVQIFSNLPAAMVAANPQLAMAAALSNFALGQYRNTIVFLNDFLKFNPEHLGASRLLAASLLAVGEARGAVKLLQPLLGRYPDDLQMLDLLATAYERIGQHAQSLDILQRLEALGQNNAALHTRVALARVNAGQTARGIAELRATFADDPTQADAGFALAIAYLKQARHREALDTLESLLRQAPDNPLYLNLRGLAYYGAGQTERARAEFDKLVATHPEFRAARMNLAKVEIAAGDYAAAEQRLTALLAEMPNDPDVLFEQAKLEHARQRLGEALKLAEQAVLLAPRRIDNRRFLADLYFALGKNDQAEQTAREAAAKNEDSLDAQALLAQTLARENKTREALLVYSRMAIQATADSAWLYRIAQAQMALHSYEEARHNLAKAMTADPGYLPARIAHAEVHFALGKPDAGLKLARETVAAFPDAAPAHDLLGRALLSIGQFAAAETSFTRASELDYRPEYGIGRMRALAAQSRFQDAEAVIEGLLSAHPRDTVLVVAHAELLIAQARWAAAEAQLRAALTHFPEQPQLLNNLAYVLARLNRDEALDYARRAQAAAPHDALINDTLGWILVQRKQTEEGLMYLRQAVARAATNAELRFHLAAALAELGREAEARAELDRALADPAPFDGRDEAERLRARLR